MKKYLIKLADHLDKKGLMKEANYIDWIIKNALPEHSLPTNYDGGGAYVEEKSKNETRKERKDKVVPFCQNIVEKGNSAWKSLDDKEYILYMGCLLTGTYGIEKEDILFHLTNIYDTKKVGKEMGIVFYNPEGRYTSEEVQEKHRGLFSSPKTRPMIEKLDKILDPNDKLK